MALLIQKKKAEKRRKLLDAAYGSFLAHGISSASIADICQRAGLAKGTFYLYFADKEAIMKALNLRISYTLLEKAYERMSRKRSASFTDNVIAMADYVLDYLAKDPEVLQLLRRDFTWPSAGNEFLETDDPLLRELREEMASYAKRSARTPEEVRQLIFVLTEMLGTAAYSSIIECYPCPIRELKPVLYAIIRRSFS